MITKLNGNIRIVLVRTSHPGNIGSAARAMKTMGLNSLYLVQPKSFPDLKAVEMASNADDLLEKAIIVNSLDEAINDCRLVLGSSARTREITWPTCDVRVAAVKIIEEAQIKPVAILFGNERTGLLNEELQYCHYQLNIPANHQYSSLNLAAAVQIISYELRMAWLNNQSIIEAPFDELATVAELTGFYQHLKTVLSEIDFLNPSRSMQVINRLKRLFNRARLEQKEVKILRGVLTAVERSIRN